MHYRAIVLALMAAGAVPPVTAHAADDCSQMFIYSVNQFCRTLSNGFSQCQPVGMVGPAPNCAKPGVPSIMPMPLAPPVTQALPSYNYATPFPAQAAAPQAAQSAPAPAARPAAVAAMPAPAAEKSPIPPARVALTPAPVAPAPAAPLAAKAPPATVPALPTPAAPAASTTPAAPAAPTATMVTVQPAPKPESVASPMVSPAPAVAPAPTPAAPTKVATPVAPVPAPAVIAAAPVTPKPAEPAHAAPAVAPAAAPIAPAPVSITLEDGLAHFDFNRAELSERGRAELDAWLKQPLPKGKSLRVTGHADRLGSTAYNLKLSDRRAETVKKYLVGKGVEASAVQVVAKGESQPVKHCKGGASKTTIACLAPNRRVEIDP